ncbi:MAG: TIGR00296 family protein [Candidatus Altiarchaeota archaeon]
MKLSLDEGREVVSFARNVVEQHFEGVNVKEPETISELLMEKRGVFVTLHTHSDGGLRGCIGFPEPMFSLGKAIRNASISSAFNDPRFPPLKKDEVDSIIFEVSVLTEPEIIKVDKALDYPKHIKIGEDGLIIRKDWAAGLLLPQVPVEEGWDVEEYLSYICQKAGLAPDAWLSDGIQLYKFSAQIFSEEAPNGEVVEKKLVL